jgi:hypothetical protein
MKKIQVPRLYYKEYDYGIKYKRLKNVEGYDYDSEKIYEVKWGQRKLFIVELYFITLFASVIPKLNVSVPKITHVIYAGSSPGTHLLILAKLFPDLKFILCDPRPPGFDWRASGREQFRYVDGYYTSKVGKKYWMTKILKVKMCCLCQISDL